MKPTYDVVDVTEVSSALVCSNMKITINFLGYLVC